LGFGTIMRGGKPLNGGDGNCSHGIFGDTANISGMTPSACIGIVGWRVGSMDIRMFRIYLTPENQFKCIALCVNKMWTNTSIRLTFVKTRILKILCWIPLIGIIFDSYLKPSYLKSESHYWRAVTWHVAWTIFFCWYLWTHH